MKKGLLFTLLMFAFCIANAQLTGWQFALPITINNTGAALTNYQIKLTISTSPYVTGSEMNSLGNDIRFASDGCGVNLLPYYIESGMNTTATNIWVKVDNIPAGATKKIFMFFGNASATAASTFTVFNGPYSATNAVTGGTTASSPNSQYGFRFSPNQDILVTSLGKYEPTGSMRYISVFNYASQALLKQMQVSGAASTYAYTSTTPIWLTQGTEYLVEMYNGSTDDHYYGATGTLNSALTFYDTRYCHSCTENTFPTSATSSSLYGYPDFEFYTRNIAATPPTYTLGVKETPITSQTPAVDVTKSPSGNVCPGTNITFTATPTNGGSTPVYQWKLNGSNVGTNSTTYSSSTLVAGDVVSCVMTSSLTCVTAATATDELPALVRQQPVIAQEPVNKVHCAGEQAYFRVKTPGLDLSYQWQVNNGGGFTDLADDATYTGSNTDSLRVATAIGLHNYEYRCIVSGPCSFLNDTSAVSVLQVYIRPTINTEPPASKLLCPGQNATLALSASGSINAYQWQVNTGSGYVDVVNNGTHLGATTPTLDINGVTTAMNGYQYRCIVKGGCGNDTSTVGTLTVFTVAGIGTHPANVISCIGTTVDFSVVGTGSNLLYQWQINTGSGFTALSNGGDYSGVTQPTLTVSNTSLAMHNHKFRCVVQGSCGNATSNEATLEIYIQTTINTEPPAAKNICPGQNATLALTASGGLLTYQWQVNTGSVYSNITNNSTYLGATTATLDINNATIGMNGYKYRCIVKGGCESDTSIVSDLTVFTVAGIATQPANKISCIGDANNFTVGATGSNLLYQWEVNTGSGFTALSNGPDYSGVTQATLTVSNTSLAMHNHKFRCVVQGSCGTVTSNEATLEVYTQTTITTEPPATRLQCPGTNTTLALTATGGLLTYQWQVNTGSGYSNITNNSTYLGATTATLDINSVTTGMNGYKYRCVVKGGCKNDTSVVTDLTVFTVISIATQPVDKKPCAGTTVTFAVTINGSNPTYQWEINTGSGFTPLSNGGAYSGADQATLTVSNTTLAMDNNKFRCVINGSCGTATSTEAKLNVTAQPTINITSPGTSVCANLSLQFTATATDAGTPPNYQWKKNGTNVGSNSTTYTASGLQTNDVITCELGVTSLCPAVPTLTSNSITITQIPTIPTSVTISSQYGPNSCIGLPVTFTATPVNPGTNPVYQWKKNSVNVGTNSPVYTTTGIVNGDVITCQLSSSVVCPDPVVASSNSFNMTLYPVLPATVALSVTPDSVECAGNTITFNSYYTNGGANPQYQWQLNGADIPGATQATYTSNTLNDNDLVACVFSSSTYCIFPVTSAPVKLDITQPVTPSVSIWGVPVTGGVRFTADIVNGGSNPVIQWRKNGKDIWGENGTTYDALNIKLDDVITAYLVSSIECTTSPAAVSNGLTILKVTGIKNVTGGFSELNLFPNPNKGTFTVHGTLNENVDNPDVKVEVVNALGQVVYTNTTRIDGRELNLSVNMNGTYAAGMYTVRLVVDGNVSNIRFIIKD